MSLRNSLDDFFSQRTLAVVGVSRTPADFSRKLVQSLRERDYIVHTVNPHVDSLDQHDNYRRIQDLPGNTTAALLMLPEAAFDDAIRECVTHGMTHIWVYGVGHPRPVSDDVRRWCEQRDVTLINGLCPRMFLSGSAWPHRLHGWFASRSRNYRTPPAPERVTTSTP
jgi:predicted CoA-binding protein